MDSMNLKLFDMDPEWLKRISDDVFLVQSGTNKDTWYRVQDGKCECLGYESRGNCRHVKLLVQEGLVTIHHEQVMKPWRTVSVAEAADYYAVTARYQNKNVGSEGLVPVQTSLGAPKFKTGYSIAAHLDSVKPDWKMLKLHTSGEYLMAYRKKLQEFGAHRILDQIRMLGQKHDGTPVLMCFENIDFENQEAFCHRRLMADFIQEELGIEIPELEE